MKGAISRSADKLPVKLIREQMFVNKKNIFGFAKICCHRLHRKAQMKYAKLSFVRHEPRQSFAKTCCHRLHGKVQMKNALICSVRQELRQQIAQIKVPKSTNDEGCDASEVDQGTKVRTIKIILATPKLVATDYTKKHR